MVTFSYLQPLPMKQKSGLPNPVTSSPAFRRRRTIWLLLACIICGFLFFSPSISLYPSSLFGSSPTEHNSLGRDVLELHGLQHFVLNSDLSLHDVLYKANKDRPQGVPVHGRVGTGGDGDGDGVPDAGDKRLDPTKEIDLKVYSSFDGDDDWVKHVKELRTQSPLVVFSKVRVCRSLNSLGGSALLHPFLLRDERLTTTCHLTRVTTAGSLHHTTPRGAKVILPILKTRQKPHPDLRSRPPT
jgi:hypothetical protein